MSRVQRWKGVGGCIIRNEIAVYNGEVLDEGEPVRNAYFHT